MRTAARTFSATDAKNNFGVVLESLATSPVRIEKNGQPVAVMLSAREFEALEDQYAMVRAKERLLARDPATMDALRRYAECQISSSEAMEQLGLPFQGQLLDLLGMTTLPFPSLPEARIDAMVEEVNKALSGDSR